ncbi:MAG TPA: cytochrome c [Gemmatimonadales bacterium]
MSVPRPSRLLPTLLLLAACGGGGEQPAPQGAAPAAAGGDLTAFQVEHGIGPITEPVTLAATPDAAMAAAGKAVFDTKCSACHKMGEKYVGPALGEVTTRRSPAFIMNMMLNPQEMIERHPVVKQLVAEMMSFMPNQGLTQDEARQVLEYLRTQSKGAAQ